VVGIIAKSKKKAEKQKSIEKGPKADENTEY
jgi:hypothetical protein